MNTNFEVGEIAIVDAPFSTMHKEEVTIIGPLEWREGLYSMDTGQQRKAGRWYHKVSSPGIKVAYPKHKKETAYCPVEHLRKKRPPGELKGSWHEIFISTGWQPSEKKVLQATG